MQSGSIKSEREQVLLEIERQLNRLEDSDFARLIPEVGSNLAYAVENPRDSGDVAAVPGRIRNAMGKPVFLAPKFGASTHVASMIIGANRHDPDKRCAMNVRYSEGIVAALKGMGLDVAFVDRMSEPGTVKKKEGNSVPWVLENACEKRGSVPDVIYHRGSVGKEAIIQILGKDPDQVVGIVLQLLDTA